MTLPENKRINRLARFAQHGCVAAARELFRIVGAKLLVYFGRRAHGIAEDVVQTACRKMAENLTRYRPEMDFMPWAFTIAQNVWRDELKRMNASPPLLPLRDMVAPTRQVSEDELHAWLHDCMKQLSEEERTIIALRFWDDLPLREVAEQLHEGYDSVRGRMFRLKKKLRLCLDKKEAQDS